MPQSVRDPNRETARSSRRPRAGLEDARRHQLIEATIATIADLGFRAATIGAIAERAGTSVGLVAFYFGDKDGLLEATLRHLATQLSQSHRALLRQAHAPRERVAALVEASLGASQFDRRHAAVWLAFWAEVPFVARFARVQRVYARRIASNLTAAFLPLTTPERARRLAEATAALIDGCWLRATLGSGSDGAAARALVLAFVDTQIALLTLPLHTGAQ